MIFRFHGCDEGSEEQQCSCKLDEFWVTQEELRVDCGGYAGEAFKKGGAGGVEKLVGDAVDAAVLDCAEMMPVALLDDAG